VADAEHLARLDAFGLTMIEQPLGREDLVQHAELQRRLVTPLCLDESITDVDRARDMIVLGSGRIVNIKPGAWAASRRPSPSTTCARGGAAVWCGGMLESGVGARTTWRSRRCPTSPCRAT
jgi:O-succinylbenzoate synthase